MYPRKELRFAYGFDDVAIVPGEVTLNPEMTDIGLDLGGLHLSLPIIASAMDAVVDVRFASAFSKVGGLAVMNLEGVQTRYEDAAAVLAEMTSAPNENVTALLQKVYSAPIKEELVGERVSQIKESGALCAVSTTPANTKRLAPLAAEAGADVFVVQSTVTTARHASRSMRGLVFQELCQQLKIPVIAGNTVTFGATRELMESGVAAILVGVGPGAACTSREVLGIGVPQVTATIECAAARDSYYQEAGRYVPIITDGGIRNGGDLCKAMVAGADAVMIASIFAGTDEAPGRGYNWGMATGHGALPRGTRVQVKVRSTLERVLFGPTSRTDGAENLTGALRTAMGMCGAQTIKEFQQSEMLVAPSVATEGKSLQRAMALSR